MGASQAVAERCGAGGAGVVAGRAGVEAVVEVSRVAGAAASRERPEGGGIAKSAGGAGGSAALSASVVAGGAGPCG